MPLGSPFYIERKSDRQALAWTQSKGGATGVIVGSRQSGKSSLLVRTLAEAPSAGKTAAYLDFQLFDEAALSEPGGFFRQFAEFLGHQLGIADDVGRLWKPEISNVQNCTRYFERHILSQAKTPLVLGFDEVDRAMTSPFAPDFFGMLRAWHNNRAFSSTWTTLTIVLVSSTEPTLFMEDPRSSPFNIGDRIRPADFTFSEAGELNRRYGSPLREKQLIDLMNLLGGHPYLTQMAFHQVTAAGLGFAEVVRRASDDDGPFGDHLRSFRLRLQGRPEVQEAFREVLDGKQPEPRLAAALLGAGLVRGEGRLVKPRSDLYARFLFAHV